MILIFFNYRIIRGLFKKYDELFNYSWISTFAHQNYLHHILYPWANVLSILKALQKKFFLWSSMPPLSLQSLCSLILSCASSVSEKSHRSLDLENMVAVALLEYVFGPKFTHKQDVWTGAVRVHATAFIGIIELWFHVITMNPCFVTNYDPVEQIWIVTSNRSLAMFMRCYFWLKLRNFLRI